MTAPFITTAWMPISAPSPIVQPCSIAWWPTVTRLPIVSGKPGSACSTAPSWTLLSSPIAIGSLSARATAPARTVARSPTLTAPISVASAAT